jgi:hypothetical protein
VGRVLQRVRERLEEDQAIWPPSGWYNKKWLEVDDTLTVANRDSGVRVVPPMLREHYCLTRPIPDACNLLNAPFWIGLKLLGAKNSAADTVAHKRYSLSAWAYAPGSRCATTTPSGTRSCRPA